MRIELQNENDEKAIIEIPESSVTLGSCWLELQDACDLDNEGILELGRHHDWFILNLMSGFCGGQAGETVNTEVRYAKVIERDERF